MAEDDLEQARRVIEAHDLAVHGIPITHGVAENLKSSTFQAHACPVDNEEDVDWVLGHLADTRPWSAATAVCCAYRLGDDEDEEPPLEGFEDGGDHGAGERLLCLLQRWEVLNVAVIVTRIDRKGLLQHMGAQRHCMIVSLGKAVLEQCYIESQTEQQEAELAMVAATEKLKELEAARSMPVGRHAGAGGPKEDHIYRRERAGREAMAVTDIHIAPETVEWPSGYVPTMFGGKPSTKAGRLAYYGGALTSDEPDPVVGSPRKAPAVLTHDSRLKARDALVGERAVGLVAPPVITKDTLSMLKLVHMPDEDVRLVLQLVAGVVYGILKPMHWRALKDMLSTTVFSADCHRVTPATLSTESAFELRRYVAGDQLSVHSLRRRQPLVAELLRWLTDLLQLHDFLATGMPPPDMAYVSPFLPPPISTASDHGRVELTIPHQDVINGLGSCAALSPSRPPGSSSSAGSGPGPGPGSRSSLKFSRSATVTQMHVLGAGSPQRRGLPGIRR